jgi:hypothetical protein
MHDEVLNVSVHNNLNYPEGIPDGKLPEPSKEEEEDKEDASRKVRFVDLYSLYVFFVFSFYVFFLCFSPHIHPVFFACAVFMCGGVVGGER